MGRDSPLPKGALRGPTNLPLHLRLQQLIRRRLKLLSRSSAVLASYRDILVILSIITFILVFATLLKTFLSRPDPFDDIADMRLLAEEDALYLEQKRNQTLVNFADPLADFNATEVKTTRAEWDWIYGEIVRRPNPPTLTKYKTRLLRELYKKTQYKAVLKYAPQTDVSCNYLNDIDDTGKPHAFECTPTSHRCPDGKFTLQQFFAPKEGSSITWDDVVIVLLISAGREAYLQAAAETWIPRLREEASLFFARDAGFPVLPESLANRPNTHVFDYDGEAGLEGLDNKAFHVWNHAYVKFVPMGKKYFLKIDDDAFLVGHNLIRFLNKMEHFFSGSEEALYFGHPFCGHGDLKALDYATWCYAGGGAYGLSAEAVLLLVNQIKGGCSYFYDYVANSPNGRPENDRYGGHYEDVMVGRCLRQAKNRRHVAGTSLLACGSFFPYAPLHYYERFGKSKEAMCNKLNGEPITIHNLEPSAIQFLDHLLYEYPLGGDVTPFSPQNEHVQELIDQCRMEGKKMTCDLSHVSPVY